MERRLLGLVPRRVVVLVGVLAAGQGVLLVVQAELLVRAVAGLDAGPLPWLAGAVAGRAVLAWVSGLVAGGAAARVKRGLRGALLGRPAGEAGARVTLLTRGLDGVDPFFTGYVPQLVAACVVPVVVLARLAAVDWASALVVAVTVPLVPVFGALVGMRTAELTGRQWGLLHRLGGHFRDVVAGLGTLRAFGRAGHQSAVVRELAGEHRRASVRALRVAFLSSLVLELVCALSVALVAVPVGLRLLGGEMALAAGLLVLVLTPEVFLPLRALGQRFHASAEGVAAAREAFAVLDAPAGSRGGGGVVPGEGAPEIVLEEVTVRYPGAAGAALDRVSLRVGPGERVAVVGPSGAGKSTLLLVLAGLVSPDSGRVLVDGVDLSDLDVGAWRARVGWVPQRPHLFAASVADNVRLGDPGAGAGRVEEAARAAAMDFVGELPEGLETVLGEGGAGLSAGQRQRLAIARAYLSGGPVMLLDEPTARLDLHSERVLVEAAAGLLAGRTAVVVAHRPALLGVVDRVVRLEGGRLCGPAGGRAGARAGEAA
ncbi:thiol reductant ABC exporter subunit CydD [Actinomadura sp. WMMA1423]|uniref:thiol reductant ABC exporter subunit CydD n=1 Tax=Actinomadura sp. WMMA1423 TaxID=2591108 RepID=UPI001F0F9712|nr:thiol reductant ABC exporter subunit CydD [Actinomadura sp. WMMA1423]